MATAISRAEWVDQTLAELMAPSGGQATYEQRVLLQVLETMKRHSTFMTEVFVTAPDWVRAGVLRESWRRHELVDLIRLMVKHHIDPETLLIDLEAQEAGRAGRDWRNGH